MKKNRLPRAYQAWFVLLASFAVSCANSSPGDFDRSGGSVGTSAGDPQQNFKVFVGASGAPDGSAYFEQHFCVSEVNLYESGKLSEKVNFPTAAHTVFEFGKIIEFVEFDQTPDFSAEGTVISFETVSSCIGTVNQGQVFSFGWVLGFEGQESSHFWNHTEQFQLNYVGEAENGGVFSISAGFPFNPSEPEPEIDGFESNQSSGVGASR